MGFVNPGCILAASGATVSLSQDFFRDGANLARAQILLACVKQATGSAARIPPRWRDALAASGEL